jgi:DNA-binding XRE family transcriptional regulator
MSYATETPYNDPELDWGDDVARRPKKGTDDSSPSPDHLFFAKKVEAARLAAGMTQVELSNLSGLTQSHISQLERAVWEPRLTTIMALAEALQVEPADLLPPLKRKPRTPRS